MRSVVTEALKRRDNELATHPLSADDTGTQQLAVKVHNEQVQKLIDSVKETQLADKELLDELAVNGLIEQPQNLSNPDSLSAAFAKINQFHADLPRLKGKIFSLIQSRDASQEEKKSIEGSMLEAFENVLTSEQLLKHCLNELKKTFEILTAIEELLYDNENQDPQMDVD